MTEINRGVRRGRNGRPPLPAGEGLDASLQLRLRPGDLARLRAAAGLDEMDFPDWCRMVLLNGADMTEDMPLPAIRAGAAQGKP